jgi:hypothetical protein
MSSKVQASKYRAHRVPRCTCSWASSLIIVFMYIARATAGSTSWSVAPKPGGGAGEPVAMQALKSTLAVRDRCVQSLSTIPCDSFVDILVSQAGYADGTVAVFKWADSGWFDSQTLTSPRASYDGFGLSLALTDCTLIVGTPYALDGTLSSAGGVVVFRRPSQMKLFVWEATLSPPSSSYTISAHDNYGLAVAALSDDVFAVSSRSGGGRNGGGSVFVYQRYVSSNATATVVVWTLVQVLSPPLSSSQSFFGSSLSCGSVGGSVVSGVGSVLAVGAPYYQTDYVPWPFVTTLYSGTAEVYVMVSLVDDFESYDDGAWLTVGDGRKLGSLWSSVSYGVIRKAGSSVGTCEVSSSVLSFGSGASGSQVLTVPLFVPNGGSMTLSLQYCSDPPSEGESNSDVTAMLVRWESGTVLSVLRLFDFGSFNGSMGTVTIPVSVCAMLGCDIVCFH